MKERSLYFEISLYCFMYQNWRTFQSQLEWGIQTFSEGLVKSLRELQPIEFMCSFPGSIPSFSLWEFKQLSPCKLLRGSRLSCRCPALVWIIFCCCNHLEMMPIDDKSLYIPPFRNSTQTLKSYSPHTFVFSHFTILLFNQG